MVFVSIIKLFIAVFKDNKLTIFLIYLYREISLYLIDRAFVMVIVPNLFVVFLVFIV